MWLMRGRRRKAAGPRMSNHRSLTGFTLVKNRWPPMSKRQPSRTAVRLIPPTTRSASSSVGFTPRLVSMYAAVSPAGPAPMMTTSCATSCAPSRAAASPDAGSGVGVGWLTGRSPGIRYEEARREVTRLRAPAVYGPMLPGPGSWSGSLDAQERQRGVADQPRGREHERPAFHLVAVGDHGEGQQERERAPAVALERVEVVGRQSEQQGRHAVERVRRREPAHEHDQQQREA